MINFLQSTEFPSQRVSDTEKEKYEWYSQCCDFIIAQGESFRNTKDIELKYDILQGKLPEEFYRKTIKSSTLLLNIKHRFMRFSRLGSLFPFVQS